MSKKINQLINSTAPGAIILQAWLTENGISPSLAQKYTQSEWLVKLRAGVYVRPGRKTSWCDAVYSLKHQLRVDAHLAGLTSLQQQGKAHYLQLNDNDVWISTKNKAAIPTWFKAFPNTHKDLNQWVLISQSKLSNINDADIVTLNVNGVELEASNTELAAFELLESMPKQISFEYAAELFQGLVNLSPKKVMSLLQRSSSVQTNRLYLFLAHYYKHPWVKRIDESTINLGTGKRQVVKGGKLDTKYNITVPDQFVLSRNEHG